MAADPARIVKRLDALKALRQPHEYLWRDCFDNSFPMRGSGLQGNSLNAQSGMDVKSRLVDSTATDAGRILASSLQGGMTPASGRWFELDVHQAQDDAKLWLDNSADQLHQEIHNTNFDSEGFEAMLDMVAAGWFAMFVDQDRKNGGLVFDSWPIAQVYASSTNASGIVDTVHRAYQLSAEQCMDEFDGKCSDVVKAKYATDPDDLVDLVHAIYPRKVYATGAQMARNLPVASCHVEVTAKHLLRESGYQEMPVVVPRWSVIPDTAYATGPMFDVLADVRMLNDLKRMDLAAADIAISGMWKAVDDGVLNPRTIKVGPRKVIVMNDIKSMEPLVTGANWQLADVRIAQLQGSIRKLLMADQLHPQDGPAMTATEIHARIALIRQQLGPMFGRMQAEYLNSLVTRCFMLAFRAGIFPPPPVSLANRAFSVQYISPLARSQKLEDVTAIQTFNATQAPLWQVNPSLMDGVDFDEQQRTLADGLGVPFKTMNDADKVTEIRDARAKQQAQQAAQAQAQQAQTMAMQGAIDGQAKAA